MPSFVLIHLTVWPQKTNVTDRQTDRQRTDSIGRTVLQTVAKKCTIVQNLRLLMTKWIWYLRTGRWSHWSGVKK